MAKGAETINEKGDYVLEDVASSGLIGTPDAPPPVFMPATNYDPNVLLGTNKSVGAETDYAEKEERYRTFLSSRSPIFDYKEVDFEHFKNRYGPDDGRHLIEVLVSSPTIRDEINLERESRKLMRRSTADENEVDAGSMSWWQRIRINSRPVLSHLRRLANEETYLQESTSRVFFRPFEFLIHFQPQMREILEELEKKERRNGADAVSAAAGVRSEKISKLSLDEIDALRHLRFYVNFIEQKIIPINDYFSDLSRKRVRFNDLTLLFKPGDLVYYPSSGSTAAMSKRNYQNVWRAYHVRRANYDNANPDDIEGSTEDVVTLCCYYIDYSGESYGVVKQKIILSAYTGEKNITDLEVYPLRHAENAAEIEASLKAQGHKFLTCVKKRHAYYEGWTIPADTEEAEDGQRSSNNPEHIDSTVILDFKEAFAHHANWRPKFAAVRMRNDTTCVTGLDKFRLAHWSDRNRTELWHSANDVTHLQYGIYTREKNHYVQNEDKFLMANKAGVIGELNDEEDIMLLPRKLVGYALRERRFAQIDILSLQFLSGQRNLFKDLKINMDHKRVLKSLVKTHFRNREIQRHQPLVGLNQDIIQGKGSGLFILLHGVPGVGKTATAEAIAQSNNKPLFHITCGDLGISPKDVENELKDIFRLAHLWDCILLLDEADIFLARRDMMNLKRNALVSVFLRVLDYYNGILILTTNRVGTLDEAFKSRIHISLYYERLTLPRTLAIFEVNIRRLREIEDEKQDQLKGSRLKEPRLEIDENSIMRFAERHFNNTDEAVRWNGRQIRNAFQIASSLARYDVHKSKSEGAGRDGSKSGTLKGGETQDPQPVLDATQFQLVSETMARFDNYFYLATGERDEDTARREMVRDDAARHEDLIPYRQPYDPLAAKSRGNKGTPNKRQSSRRREYDEEEGEEEPASRSSRRAPNQLGGLGQNTRKGDGNFGRRDVPSSSRQEWDQKVSSSQRSRYGNTSNRYASGDEDDKDDEDEDEEEDEERKYQEERGAPRRWGREEDARQTTKSRGYRDNNREEGFEEEDDDYDD